MGWLTAFPLVIDDAINRRSFWTKSVNWNYGPRLVLYAYLAVTLTRRPCVLSIWFKIVIKGFSSSWDYSQQNSQNTRSRPKKPCTQRQLSDFQTMEPSESVDIIEFGSLMECSRPHLSVCHLQLDARTPETLADQGPEKWNWSSQENVGRWKRPYMLRIVVTFPNWLGILVHSSC